MGFARCTLAVVLAGCTEATPTNTPAPAPTLTSEDEALRAIQELVEGHADREEEGRVLDLLRALEPPVLDAVVRRSDLGRLLAAVDDRALGPDHRTALLGLLAQERLGHLGIAARAALVDALQGGQTDAAEERAIAAIFEGTRGPDLTGLKNAVDAGGDERDLARLVYHDLDDEALRGRLLAHIAAEASPAGELKVLSDIDDTLYAHWKDTRYPSGTVYPGVLAFYRELDLGPAGDGREGDLVFVTARPGDRTGLVESHTHEALRSKGVGEAVVLTGDVGSLAGDEAIAGRKFEDFERYLALYPEYRYVFTGDSGQGDAAFGARMVAAHPEAVAGVFIHDVVATPPEGREGHRARGVRLFDTYLGAACEAHELGLVGDEGLSRVGRACREELGRVVFATDAERATRFADLARDRERANTRLPEASRLAGE
ncbi:MAG: hypothetical protein HY722_16190 [Planctomycetes bacterium]|nr:hypothetical protein [Planctomycetota bacterium]